ncbi:sugar transferase [Parvularcula marina]|uniref:Sugar transferase n=1 Tax=Parvularcula marina TaxID=2292771 RepID=A0A371RGD9_9PROT|nr:sugar transferase [Parvularcula marina]RFB04492.1 sugar transferase [Parvularcula marina]
MIAQNLTLLAERSQAPGNWRVRVLRSFGRMRYQLLGGLLFGVICPILLRNQGLLGVLAPNDVNYQNSLLGTFVALILGFVILRKTTALPGSTAFMNVLPAFVISFGIVIAIFYGFRLNYSRYQFLASFLFMVSWFYFVMMMIARIQRPAFGMVAGGQSNQLPGISSIDVVELKSVADADRLAGLPIVADFRSGLSGDWERYLAEQAVRGRLVFNARHLIESLEGKVELEHLSENSLGQLSLDQIYRPAKRYVDALAAAIVLLVASPFLFAIGVAIRLDSTGPALFRQTRIGFRGEPFTVYKFRSMKVVAPEEENLTGDMTQSGDDRITRLGHILRKLRIDELPQLINVVRGEMSWIGPRPETLRLSRWYEQEIPFYRIRHAVRPGITGWAQVCQGHVTSVDDVREKLQYDLFYVKNFSVWFDVLIVIHTIRVMLTGKGAK